MRTVDYFDENLCKDIIGAILGNGLLNQAGLQMIDFIYNATTPDTQVIGFMRGLRDITEHLINHRSITVDQVARFMASANPGTRWVAEGFLSACESAGWGAWVGSK